MSLTRRLIMAAGILTGLAACVHVRVSSGKPAPTIQSVEAIRYATLSNFPVASLVRGADTSRHLDIAAMVWLIRRSDGTAILMDAGFYRDKFMQRWKPTDYRLPSEAVMLAGVRPEQVTDIIVSHIHWDHMDGADLFPNAT